MQCITELQLPFQHGILAQDASSKAFATADWTSSLFPPFLTRIDVITACVPPFFSLHSRIELEIFPAFEVLDNRPETTYQRLNANPVHDLTPTVSYSSLGNVASNGPFRQRYIPPAQLSAVMFSCLRRPCIALTCAKFSRLPTAMMYSRPAELVNEVALECSEAFRYNESKRLEERYLRFSIPALVNAAAVSMGRSSADVRSIRKLAEGGFNRTFEITMRDGVQLVARLPYPSTQPKRLAVASEVATMDLARSHGVPVPKIYGYSTDPCNPVGAEYILMEKVRGQLLGDMWFTLSEKQRIKILSEIVDNEAKLFAIGFPAYGSVYYDDDLPQGMGRELLQSEGIAKQLCIGPDASLKFWFEERSAIDIERGPSAKEIAWLQAYGKSRLPFDRVYRDITHYKQSDPQEHLQNLEKYKQAARQLAPKEAWLNKPIMRHPDLNPNNIFVSESFEIVGIIDWQHSTVLPLSLHASIPKYFQNYGDPDSEDLRQPQLPNGLDELEEEDREKELELYRGRHLHFYYVGATAKKNDSHFRALMHKGGYFRRRIFQRASEPWEGNNIPLKADLIRMMQHWTELGPCSDGNDEHAYPCPISFDSPEIEETFQGMTKQEKADDEMEILRNAIGINVDGWVSYEGYKRAVDQVAEMKALAIGYAESDFEREMTTRHWPFDDHDEKE
nr:altered inheritance of mitochondria protein 9, mitochondrial [Quercus suber]